MDNSNEQLLHKNPINIQIRQEENEQFNPINMNTGMNRNFMQDMGANKTVVVKKEPISFTKGRKRNIPLQRQSGLKEHGIKNIPSPLADVIQLFIEDNRRASRFPAVKRAAIIYNRATDNEQAAEALAALAAAVIEYLETRKKSSYEDRMVNCEVFLEEYRAFMVTAGPDYIQSFSGEMRRHIGGARGTRDRNKRNLYKDYVTDVEDLWEEKIGTRDAQGVIKIMEKTGNTPMAARIRNLTEALDALKKEPIPPYPQNEEELPKYRQIMVDAGLMFTVAYNKLIDAAEKYEELNKDIRKVGNKAELYELNIYKKTADDAREELRVLSNTLSEFVNGHREADAKTTWEDIITEKQNEFIQVESDSSKKMGAGTSVVYKVKRGTDKYQFFKEEENISLNPVGTWTDQLETVKLRPGYKPEYDADLEKLDGIMRKNKENIFKELNSLLEKKDFNGAYKEERNIYKGFIGDSFKYRRVKGRPNMFKDLMTGNYTRPETMQTILKEHPFLALFGDMNITDEEEANFLGSLMEDMVKRFNTYHIARWTLNVKPGDNLSKRNVATSRIADILGIGNLVARSETAKVKKGSKEVYGNLMEEAKGLDCEDKKVRNGVLYTNECVSKFAMMEVFDWLCGQVDRNDSNYMVQTKEVEGKTYVDSVILIDNDMSFGNFDGNFLDRKKPHMKMHKYNELPLYGVPLWFRKRIKELSENSGTTKVLLGDLMPKPYVTAFVSRLRYLNKAFESLDKTLANTADSKTENPEKVREAKLLLKNDTYRSLYYQKSVIKSVTNRSKIHEDFYLRNENLRSLEDIDADIKAIENDAVEAEQENKTE